MANFDDWVDHISDVYAANDAFVVLDGLCDELVELGLPHVPDVVPSGKFPTHEDSFDFDSFESREEFQVAFDRVRSEFADYVDSLLDGALALENYIEGVIDELVSVATNVFGSVAVLNAKHMNTLIALRSDCRFFRSELG